VKYGEGAMRSGPLPPPFALFSSFLKFYFFSFPVTFFPSFGAFSRAISPTSGQYSNTRKNDSNNDNKK
jgi:hypothetical protein